MLIADNFDGVPRRGKIWSESAPAGGGTDADVQTCMAVRACDNDAAIITGTERRSACSASSIPCHSHTERKTHTDMRV